MTDPAAIHDLHNGQDFLPVYLSDVERVRWHLRQAFAAFTAEEFQAGFQALAGADRLLCELLEPEDAAA